MKNKTIILYPHGGSGNHGCEAIVRSTAKITGAGISLYSSQKGQDIKYGLDSVCDLHDIINPIKKDIRYLASSLVYHLTGNSDYLDRLAFGDMIRNAKKADLVLSIGGDNYCYGIPGHIIFLNRQFRKTGIPTVLWGCSIEKDVLTDDVVEDLSGYKLIIARESLTASYLKEAGLTNVVEAPDPAFALDEKKVSLPDWWMPGNTVGINASPMILDKSNDSELTLANYESLIEYILKYTDSSIALIPHVVWENNDDRKPLRFLYDKFSDNDRIHIIDLDYNAEELKYIISCCRFLVTARTHASIAAYSTCVPTIVTGYSVKAKGIARDIFGTSEDYVVAVQSLRDKMELVNAYKKMVRNESSIKSHLKNVIPDMKERALQMNSFVKNL